MTCALLRRRGVRVERTGTSTWRVEPGPIAAVDETVEPDLTNAATILAAALVTGGELTTAWPEASVQAADELLEVLAAFGARIGFDTTASGERRVKVSGDGVRGADVNLHAVSELTPAVAALAAVADGPSTIRGVAHIRGHETDRLAALAAGLSGLGVGVSETSDGLRITPAPRHGGTFATHADHRLAHAAALVGLVTPGGELDDVGCTTKTLPDFPGLWARLLGGAAGAGPDGTGSPTTRTTATSGPDAARARAPRTVPATTGPRWPRSSPSTGAGTAASRRRTDRW
jgi:3-phosphoshikimate 1-carboxyvinyltransferase